MGLQCQLGSHGRPSRQDAQARNVAAGITGGYARGARACERRRAAGTEQRLGHIIGDVDLSTSTLVAPAPGYLYQYSAVRVKTSECSMMWTHPHVTKDEPLIQIVVSG